MLFFGLVGVNVLRHVENVELDINCYGFWMRLSTLYKMMLSIMLRFPMLPRYNKSHF